MNFNEYCKKQYEDYVKTEKETKGLRHYEDFNDYYDHKKKSLKDNFDLINFMETDDFNEMLSRTDFKKWRF